MVWILNRFLLCYFGLRLLQAYTSRLSCVSPGGLTLKCECGTEEMCSWGLGNNRWLRKHRELSCAVARQWSGYLKIHRLLESQWLGMEAARTGTPAGHQHGTCLRENAQPHLGICAQAHCHPVWIFCCLPPKITLTYGWCEVPGWGLCTQRPRKPNSFPAARQKWSLFHHRKGENILTNACVLDGWQSCHGKEAAAPLGDGRWGAGSGNFWALLAAQVWRRATNPPLLAAHQRSNTSRLAPEARWLLRGFYETRLVFGDPSLAQRLHNSSSPP